MVIVGHMLSSCLWLLDWVKELDMMKCMKDWSIGLTQFGISVHFMLGKLKSNINIEQLSFLVTNPSRTSHNKEISV